MKRLFSLLLVFLLETRGGEADGIEAAIKNDGRYRPIGVLEHLGVDNKSPHFRNTITIVIVFYHKSA